MARRAFTLVEMMISVSLSLAIVYIAFAGFRTSSQCVTMVNRLSVENGLLRAAFHAAHDEIDFWRRCDDPDDAAHEMLRGRGLAFAPFRTQWPAATLAGAAAGDPEGMLGWNAGDRAFAAHDPRTWTRVSMAETALTDGRYGQYGMFSNLLRDPVLYGTPGGHGPGTRRNWWPNQLRSLFEVLGTYGMIDYLPANTVYGHYVSYNGGSWSAPGTTSPGCIEYFWNIYEGRVPGSRSEQDGFANGDGSISVVRGRYGYTVATAFMLPNPDFTPLGVDDTLVLNGRHEWKVGYQAGQLSQNLTPAQGGAVPANHMLDFDRRCNVPVGLMDGPDAGLANDVGEKPELWPDVTVSVSRIIKDGRFANVCRIRWTSPFTGTTQELPFCSVGTTLRGARLQRKPAPAGGWALWHGPGSPLNDRTLDDQ